MRLPASIQTSLYVFWAAFVSPLPFFEAMEAVQEKLEADLQEERKELRRNRARWLGAACAGTVRREVADRRLREIDNLLRGRL